MKKLLLSLGVALTLWASPASAVDSWTPMLNANYTATINDTRIVPTAALTAQRTLTLPSAGGTMIGQGFPASGPNGGTALEIQDVFQNVGGSNSCLSIVPASGESMNGSTSSFLFCITGGKVTLWPLNGSNWQMTVQGPGVVDPANISGGNAASGTLGEYKNSVLAPGNQVTMTTTVAQNITTLSLTPGDWDCYGTIARFNGASTSYTILEGSINQTSGTIGAQGTEGTTINHTAANVMGNTGWDTLIGPIREALASTTTIYLVADDTFSVSTDTAYGEVRCRRVQ